MIGTLKEWSKDVKIEMIRNDLSYKELAVATGISPGYLTSIVNVRVISPRPILKVSEVLGVEVPEEIRELLRNKNVS